MLFKSFVSLTLLIATVNSWGGIGHSLVGQIAQTILTINATNFVRDHLPWYTNGSLSLVASWADTIASPITNPVEYLNWQWSIPLHRVTTSDWLCNYDHTRDCNWNGGQRCVDGGIQNYTRRLADSKQDGIQRQEALKFLVHFIGDVHQPLHGGFKSDDDGLLIQGFFLGEPTTLHGLWDTLLIEHRILLDFNNDTGKYYDYLLNLMNTTYAKNISQWSTCPSSDISKYSACSATWIREDTVLNCARVYLDEDGKRINRSQPFHLGQTYYNTNIDIVEQRLIQGGLRLGTVINKIVELEQRDHHHHRRNDDQLRIGRILLILISMEILLVIFCFMYCLVRRIRNQQSLDDMPTKYESFDDIKE